LYNIYISIKIEGPILITTEMTSNKNDVIDLTEDDTSHKSKRKQYIPKIVKTQVWENYIGKGIGHSSCMCCKIEIITPFNYHCGHVISEANNGDISIYNLRPVCAGCNLSMGKKDMRDFMKKCNYGELNDHVYDMDIDN
jgi:hypothetical protein